MLLEPGVGVAGTRASDLGGVLKGSWDLLSNWGAFQVSMRVLLGFFRGL